MTIIKLGIEVPSYKGTIPHETPNCGRFKVLPERLRIVYAALVFVTFACIAACQETSRIRPTGTSERESRDVLGIIPNYRTFPSVQNYEPLTSRETFKIASEDSLDRGTFALAAGFGGLGQMTASNKSFGQGAAGGAREPVMPPTPTSEVPEVRIRPERSPLLEFIHSHLGSLTRSS